MPFSRGGSDADLGHGRVWTDDGADDDSNSSIPGGYRGSVASGTGGGNREPRHRPLRTRMTTVAEENGAAVGDNGFGHVPLGHMFERNTQPRRGGGQSHTNEVPPAYVHGDDVRYASRLSLEQHQREQEAGRRMQAERSARLRELDRRERELHEREDRLMRQAALMRTSSYIERQQQQSATPANRRTRHSHRSEMPMGEIIDVRQPGLHPIPAPAPARRRNSSASAQYSGVSLGSISNASWRSGSLESWGSGPIIGHTAYGNVGCTFVDGKEATVLHHDRKTGSMMTSQGAVRYRRKKGLAGVLGR